MASDATFRNPEAQSSRSQRARVAPCGRQPHRHRPDDVQVVLVEDGAVMVADPQQREMGSPDPPPEGVGEVPVEAAHRENRGCAP